MKLLQRYIAKTIILSTLIVMLVVIGMSFFISVLGEFRDIGTGEYGFAAATIHSLLRLPFNLYQFFPMVALLGGVLGLGTLATHQELMIMRASGVSFFKITGAVISGIVVLIIIATALGEGVSPYTTFLADKYKNNAESGGQAVATLSGVWVHEGNDFFHVNQVIGTHHLQGVTRYQFDAAHHLLAAYRTETMDYDQGHWLLRDMMKTSFKQNNIVTQSFPEAVWDLTLNPNLLTIGLVEPEEMMLGKLMRYSNHLIENGNRATEFQFSFWKRIFQPLATIVMVLLAIPFVFGFSRSVMMGWRIFMGVMVGFIFYMLNAFLGQVCVVFQLPPLIAALAPLVLFTGLGYVAAMRVSR
jgi:lipopolysaccharide export system permease protein